MEEVLKERIQSKARRASLRAVFFGAAIVLLVSLGLSVGGASAATITVNTVDDESITNGHCSLREAIRAANLNTPVDACARGMGADVITISVTGTITLGSALPSITEQLTIVGPGPTAADLTISGNNAVQVLVNGRVMLEVRDLTIADASADSGAGIFNTGTLTVSHCVFSNNRANRFDGGAILNSFNATLTVTDSIFSGNGAGSNGGAISNGGGTLSVSDSTFSENRSQNGGAIITSGGIVSDSSFLSNTASINGGGIVNFGPMMVTGSTFFNNSASSETFGAGGAIFSGGGPVSALTVINSTFSGNSAAVVGGGIRNQNGPLAITNCTFTGNGAPFAGGINSLSSATLRNTIVANSPSGGNCVGPITDGGGNLDYPGGLCGLHDDPLLGPLMDNGGPTLTHALGAGSPALDGAVDDNCPSTDQRGIARPYGAHCDIGAYESENRAPAANAGADQVLSAGPTCTADVTLHGEGSSDPDGDVLTYAWSGASVAASGATPMVSLPLGLHSITLTVEDGRGGSDTDEVEVTVTDITAPVFSGVPEPIVAECASATLTPVSVPLPTATDNCDGPVPVSSDAPAAFPMGTATVTFTASDSASNGDVATTTVTVGDATPPSISSLNATPDVLWPPNHEMVPVAVATSASDLCGAVSCQIASVASNEPDSDAAEDWQITGPLRLDLRAERLGSGSGRVYTITLLCRDESGNDSTGTVTVTVPNSQGGNN